MRLQLDSERHAGERRVTAERVRDQLAGAPLEPAHRVQPARRLHGGLLKSAIRLELDADEGIELQAQLFRVDHQAQVIPRAGLERGEPLLLGRRRRRDHENRRVPGDRAILPEGAAHRNAVQVLKVRVHENDVGPRGGCPVQQLAPAPHGHDPIPQRLEHAVERLVEPRSRVGDQHGGWAGERRARRQCRALRVRSAAMNVCRCPGDENRAKP